MKNHHIFPWLFPWGNPMGLPPGPPRPRQRPNVGRQVLGLGLLRALRNLLAPRLQLALAAPGAMSGWQPKTLGKWGSSRISTKNKLW